MTPRTTRTPVADPRIAARARAVRQRPWRLIGIGVAALAVAALVVWTVWFSPLFVVSQVEVRGVSGTAAGQVAQAAQVPTGQPLARVDLEGAGHRVLASPLYASAEVARRWPRTIIITVTPRQPVIAVRDGSGVKLVDKDGVAYDTVPTAPSGVPVVNASGAAGTSTSPAALRVAVSMMAALPSDLRARVSGVTVSSANLVSFSIEKVQVIWGGADEAQRKVDVVKVLLAREGVKVIDVSSPQVPVTR